MDPQLLETLYNEYNQIPITSGIFLDNIQEVLYHSVRQYCFVQYIDENQN